MSAFQPYSEVYANLAEYYPEPCRRFGLCERLQPLVSQMAIRVCETSLTYETASSEIQKDAARVSEHCLKGQLVDGYQQWLPVCGMETT